MTRLSLITTGGTVVMARRPGEAGADVALGAEALIRAAGLQRPGLHVHTQQPFDLPSANIGAAHLRRLVRAVESAAAAGADGIVVAHGTDTLEETAFGLDLLYRGRATVVVTGAMRTSDALGADGPANLAAATAVALDPACRGLGVLVVMGDEIHAARFVRKAHTSVPSAFSSSPLGPLGWVSEGRPRVMMRPNGRLRPVRAGRGSATVPVIAVGGDTNAAWLRDVTRGASGVVFELAGGGHAPARLAPTLGRIAEIRPTVFASRTGGGSTLSRTYGYAGGEVDLLARGLIGSGELDARKARLALALLLSGGASTPAIRAWFEAPLDDEAPIPEGTERRCD